MVTTSRKNCPGHPSLNTFCPPLRMPCQRDLVAAPPLHNPCPLTQLPNTLTHILDTRRQPLKTDNIEKPLPAHEGRRRAGWWGLGVCGKEARVVASAQNSLHAPLLHMSDCGRDTCHLTGGAPVRGPVQLLSRALTSEIRGESLQTSSLAGSGPSSATSRPRPKDRRKNSSCGGSLSTQGVRPPLLPPAGLHPAAESCVAVALSSPRNVLCTSPRPPPTGREL